MSATLEQQVWAALGEVLDPEVGISVVELGLVYGVSCQDGDVLVSLTMTTPTCPLGEQICDDARTRILALRGVTSARVELVWEPIWTRDRMSEQARAALGWGG